MLTVDLLLPLFSLQSFPCSGKTSRSLLIHFCARCHTINSHVNHFLWPCDAHETVNVRKNVVKHLSFVFRLRATLRMRARMDYTVHIEVQVVDSRLVVFHLLQFLVAASWNERRALLYALLHLFFELLVEEVSVFFAERS